MLQVQVCYKLMYVTSSSMLQVYACYKFMYGTSLCMLQVQVYTSLRMLQVYKFKPVTSLRML